MRYHIPDAVLQDYPECVPERLRRFGPWVASGDSSGVTLTAKDWPAQSTYRAEGRKTPEGWTYYQAEKLPQIGQLYRKTTVAEACNAVPLACGISILVRPAYLEPRRIFSNGSMGDPITDYGIRARRVFDLLNARDPQGILHPEALQLWIDAVGTIYRATPELIDDLGIFALEDVDNVIAAVFAGPKPQPGADTSPSPSPG